MIVLKFCRPDTLSKKKKTFLNLLTLENRFSELDRAKYFSIPTNIQL